LSSCTGDFRDASHQVAEEFGGVIGVDDVGGTASEVELIEKTRYKGGCLSVWEWDKQDGFGEAIDEGEGFGLARGGETLPLKIHRVAGAGFAGCIGRK
jgi:hypothetical protein